MNVYFFLIDKWNQKIMYKDIGIKYKYNIRKALLQILQLILSLNESKWVTKLEN